MSEFVVLVVLNQIAPPPSSFPTAMALLSFTVP